MIAVLLIRRNVPKAFKALDDHDLDEYLKDWAEDAVFVYLGDIPGISGIHSGKKAIRELYEKDLGQFPKIHRMLKSISVARILDITGDNIANVHWEVEATNRTGYTIENSGVTVMTIRSRKVVHTIT